MFKGTIGISCAALLVAAARQGQPHIVMFVVDDMGWADVSYHGGNFPSPNMDSLSADGVRFDRYYTQQVCSPTRSALMTGRYPFHIGMHHATTIMAGSTAAIPKDIPTISELLGDQGYRSHAIGKWHLGYASWSNTPLGRGFESYAGYLQGAVDYYNKTFGVNQAGHTGIGFDFWRNKTAAWDQVGLYAPDFYQAEAQRVISSHNVSEPMFMYYAHQLIHEPDEEPTGTQHQEACGAVNQSDPGPRFATCTMQSRVDSDLGELVEMLREKGMWDNTILWMVSDNGGMVDQPEYAAVSSGSSNWPLRAGKATLFEGGVRCPSFLTGGRDVLPAPVRNKTVNELLHHVDVAKTLCVLGGCDGSRLGTDGYDVWESLVLGKSSVGTSYKRTELPVLIDVADKHDKREDVSGNFSALIQGDWKLINGAYNFKTLSYDGWWTNDPQEVQEPAGAALAVTMNNCEGVLLFNITADPTERVNVALANPGVVAAMQARIAWYADPANGYVVQQPNTPHPKSLPALHNGTWAPFIP